MYLAIFGSAHPESVQSLQNVAAFYASIGQPGKAQELIETCGQMAG
jgi:hypothetical protein